MEKSHHGKDIPAETLMTLADGLKSHLMGKHLDVVSKVLCTKFLTGITVPVFTRAKAKWVEGFGIAQDMSYAKVLACLDAVE